MDQANLGIMETDWAENRAKIPQDIIRSTLGKLIDSVYSTAERDSFRTRLERTPNGGTEIYISHRGMDEVYTSTQQGPDHLAAAPSRPRTRGRVPAPPDGQARRPARQSKVIAGRRRRRRASSRVADVGGTPVVQIDEGFDRAWRRVGLALDRTGFTVEDRDRSQGTYFVRYVRAERGQARSRASSPSCSAARARAEAPLKYRIASRPGRTTTVSVLTKRRARHSANAQRIVQVIADDLK